MSKFALALLCAVAAGEAAAAAARVDFVYGAVTVSGADGREQPLARGAELDNGDTVRTADGRAQLRFSDGAYVSLQPNSEFAIRDYRFDGKTDGGERGFFGLARGAMRTVTGFIGRVNRDRYRVSTPTATIGIRGTGGVIQVLDDGATLVIGTSGIWSLTNPSGSIDVPAGVSGLAPSAPDAPPQQTSQAPQAGPAPLPQDTGFRQGEQLQSGLPATSEALARFAYGRSDGASAIDFPPSVSAVFNSAGQLIEADAAGTVYKLDGAHADFATDGILTWGRWIGRVSIGTLVETYGADQGLHYVIGTPTVTLPSGGTATYALAGATRPTYVNGTIAPGSFSGSLSVTFGATATINTVNWQVAMPDRTFVIADTQMSTQSSAFFATGIATQGCANAGCTSAVRGFFAGTGAERAGVAYTIDDANRVVGAAAFRKQ